MILFAQQSQVTVEGDATQRQHDPHVRQQRQFACQEGTAVRQFLGGGAVFRRGAAPDGGDEGVVQRQVVVAGRWLSGWLANPARWSAA